jgi:hypothetical protein
MGPFLIGVDGGAEGILVCFVKSIIQQEGRQSKVKTDVARVQVEISLEKLKELESLMGEVDISTKRELFNLALTLFKWTVNEVKKGRIIASVSEEGKTYKELVIPALEVIAERARLQQPKVNQKAVHVV